MENVENKSNAGFSLIEMLVSVLITGILMCAVGIFISMSNTMYQTVNTSSRLQEEASTTKNFLQEILIESTNICSGTEDSGLKYWVVKSMNNDDNSAKYLTGGTAVDYDYYIFIYSDEKLRYVKVKDIDEVYFRGDTSNPKCNNNNVITSIDSTAYASYITNQKSSRYNVISNNITAFNIDSTNVNSLGGSPGVTGTSYNLYEISVTYEYAGKQFDSKFSVNSRNKAGGRWDK